MSQSANFDFSEMKANMSAFNLQDSRQHLDTQNSNNAPSSQGPPTAFINRSKIKFLKGGTPKKQLPDPLILESNNASNGDSAISKEKFTFTVKEVQDKSGARGLSATNRGTKGVGFKYGRNA